MLCYGAHNYAVEALGQGFDSQLKPIHKLSLFDMLFSPLHKGFSPVFLPR